MRMSFPECWTFTQLVLSILTLVDIFKYDDYILKNGNYFEIWRYFTNILYLGNFDLYQIFILIFNYKIYVGIFKYAFKYKSSENFFFFLLYLVYCNLIGYFFNNDYNYYIFIFGLTYFWGKYDIDNGFFLFPPEYFYMLFN